MRRLLRIPACAPLLTLSILLGGCTTEQYARRLLHPNLTYGKAAEAALPSGPTMVRLGLIDAHRRVPTADGIEIDAWILAAQAPVGAPARGTVLLLHGLADSKASHLSLARRLSRRGFHAVLIDHRCHGRSTGRYVTWGDREKLDARRVLDTLLAERLVREPVFAFGHSMGATTAILYAAADPRCRGVVAAAPYAHGRAVTRRFVPLMSDEQFEAVWQHAGQVGGFDPDATSAIAAAERLTCPLIILHGTGDAICPYAHGKAIHAACRAPARLETVPLGGHVTILAGREAWIADRIGELAAMAGLPAPANEGHPE